MARLALALAASLLLSACGGGSDPQSTPAPPVASSNLMDPATFTIGPTVSGKNSSVGAALHPAIDPAGWGFDIPAFPAHADYVTTPYSALAGKTSITLHYRVVKTDGSRLVPTNYPDNNVAEITLFIQRRGDNWSCTGQYEPYRWYASKQTQVLDAAGDFTITASLDGSDWTGCQTSTFSNNPAGFADTIAGVADIGFVLGGGTGLGHGIGVVGGTARIVVTGFTVQ